tara:strand:- start:21986 stop:22243 length:258 start_codon:yes stop_codon:yes gene_type:complete
MARLIVCDKEGINEVVRARSEAMRLAALEPSRAAPFTDEDMAIIGMFLQQGDAFPIYMELAYQDYTYFFMAEAEKAITPHMELLS